MPVASPSILYLLVLVLEIVHNKKYDKTIDGKEAQSLYKICQDNLSSPLVRVVVLVLVLVLKESFRTNLKSWGPILKSS